MELVLPLLLLSALGVTAYRVLRLFEPLENDDRVVLATAFGPTAVVVTVQLLGHFSTVSRELLASWLGAVAVALAAISAHGGPPEVRSEAHGERPGLFTWSIAAIAAASLTCSLAAAALLDTWAWDSLGYHLPIAHDLLQTGTLREVPGHLAYIETYPRFADLFTAGFRVLLGSERFVDVSQVPFLPLLVAAAFRHGRALGVSRAQATAFACAPLAMPIVFLQCATSYVDVAYAALLVAGLGYLALGTRRAHDVLASLFLGLALATKPSAPATLSVALVVTGGLRTWRHGPRAALPLFAVGAAIAVLGGKVYLDNALRFGNPVWPIVLHLGPFTLPGYVTQDHILALGLQPWEVRMPWLAKLATSWFLEPSSPVFDMRFGGFGRAFAFGALPLAILGAVRSREVRALLLVVFASCLAQSGAFTSRYTIAVAVVTFVAAPVGIGVLARTRRPFAECALVALLGYSAVQGTRGFSDGGPSLMALAEMGPRERAYAVAPDMHGDDWRDLRDAIRPGEAFAYDKSFGLPSLAFRDDGRSRLVYLGERSPTGDELEAVVDEQRVRFLAVDDRVRSGLGSRFRPRFACAFDACTVYEVERRRPDALAANDGDR